MIETKKNKIFIAGMGGLEIGLIIQNLLPQLDETSRIVISPHRKILELRDLLHSMAVVCLSEQVIKEDGQFYQIIELGVKPIGMKVSLYGTDLWKSATGEEYRQYQLKYFDYHKDLASQAYVKFLKSLNPWKSTPKENLWYNQSMADTLFYYFGDDEAYFRTLVAEFKSSTKMQIDFKREFESDENKIQALFIKLNQK